MAPTLKKVMFVVKKCSERVAKISYSLRKVGVKTSLVTDEALFEDHNRKYFDVVHTVVRIDEVRLARILLSEAPTIIHLHSPLFDEFCVAVQDQRRCAYVYDYKDVFAATHDLGRDGNKLSARQAKLICMAPGLVYRDRQAHHLARVLGDSLPAKRTFFPDFCWSADLLPALASAEINVTGAVRGARGAVVMTGNYAIEKLHPNRAGTGALHSIERLLLEGFSVDYYPFPHGVYDFSDYKELEFRSTGRFRLQDKLSPEALMARLPEYDFAFLPIQYRLFNAKDFPIDFNAKHSDIGGAARMTEYISAGLPTVFSRCGFQSAMNKVFKFGVEVGEVGEFVIESSVLRKLSERRSNCNKLRTGAFNVDSHISRLIAFYQSVAQV